MEIELNIINDTFQSGKHEKAIIDIQNLIETYSKDDQIYKAQDHLGDYFNFIGQHTEAIQAWIKAMQLLEDTVQGVNYLRDEKMIDWMNLALKIARISYRQGKDGSEISYKNNNDTKSKINENDEKNWKKEQFEMAIKNYKGIIEKIFEGGEDIKRTIRTELAQVLFDAENFDEVIQIYDDAFNDDKDIQWLYKAADCLWQQGNKEQAYIRLQQLISIESTFAKAYQLLANYFIEKNDFIKAEEYNSKYQFYSWIPKFCQHIEYSPENVSLIQRINSDKGLEIVETILTTDTSERSTEFLAAICYHHYHGFIENKAFEILEKRGQNAEDEQRNFIGSLLILLLKKNQNICIIKGVTNALAGMKHEQTFDILEKFLPQDINPIYSMHIPTTLAKLNDPRAIPLLINIIQEPFDIENDDSDSSDEIITSRTSTRLIKESCLALASFYPDERVKQILINGLNNEDTREMCLAALTVCTGDKQYIDQIEKIIYQGNTLDYIVVKYFQNHSGQNEQIDKLLKLNQDIYKKKQNHQSDDENHK